MLLDVYVGNPNRVVIVGTPAMSSLNLLTGYDVYNNGFDMLNFFTSTVTHTGTTTGGDATTIASTLLPASETGAPYNALYWDNASGSLVDVNFFNLTSTAPGQEMFSTSTRAFSGSLSVNLGALTAALPHLGATGNIVASWTGVLPVSAAFGTWVVVPEPASAPLLAGALALAGAAIGRNRNVRLRA